MGIDITYSCDRCSHTQEVIDKPRQLWRIGITKRSLGNTGYARLDPDKEQIWCRDCCIEMHLLKPGNIDKAKPKEPVPTVGEALESIIREIIEDELEARV